MTTKQFQSSYSGTQRCIAIYRTLDGSELRGLVLDGIQKGLAGIEFIHIDNFHKAITLDNILAVMNTGKSWIKQ